MNTNKNKVGFESLVELFEQTQTELRKKAARSVDIALVVRNWLFGWYIEEFERAGVERTELYGKKLMIQLSKELTSRFGKGFSRRSLNQSRCFYEYYKEIGQTASAQSFISKNKTNKIQQTVSAQSLSAIIEQPHIVQTLSAQLFSQFTLGWSHYVTLLTIKSIEERRFYEIEVIENSWSIRELKRQIESSGSWSNANVCQLF